MAALPVPVALAGLAHEVLVIGWRQSLRRADSQYLALHRERPYASVALVLALKEGVLHRCAFAKYTVPFPRMSRSILTRASSARSRLVSICTALTALLSTLQNLPSRLALTQLNRVCSTSPKVRAAAALLCPHSTSRAAAGLTAAPPQHLHRARPPADS